jgi:hypothetical protein
VPFVSHDLTGVPVQEREAAVQARCEEEVEELQARQDEEVAELQTRHEKEIDGIQAELAGAKANARKLKIVIACLVLFCMLRM